MTAAALPTVGGAWAEMTALPYDADDPTYASQQNPVPANGWGAAAGRVQALATDGETVYAGAADGGVWRSPTRGTSWAPVSDELPSLSSGDLAVDASNGDLWYGTGEAAQGNVARSYRGIGVFRSVDQGDTWELIGGDQLDQTLIGAIELDGAGAVYAATTAGLYRRSSSASASIPWTRVLRPGTPAPFGLTFVNDVVVRPGTNGGVVVASLGWRGGKVDYNGLYVSRDHGERGSWERLRTRGDLDAREIGRASLAYSSDGSRLYALVQSWRYFEEGRNTSLYGVFLSASGAPGGPWTKIAGARKLRNASPFLTSPLAFYHPGVQAHYNQAIGVDPADRDHVYVGLEELYESVDGGDTWIAAGVHKCAKGDLDLCETTTHGDHHALAFGDGVVYSGNDGGVYRRPLDSHSVGGWVNLNGTLHALQYYAAGVGTGASGDVIWGGTHDNGISVLKPGADHMGEAHCCEGSDLIVDPSDPDRVAVVHVDCHLSVTMTGGVSIGGRSAWRCRGPREEFPIWTSPLQADPFHPNRHWVTGGRFVWETRKGWGTRCPKRTNCDWSRVRDVGADRMVSALDVSRGVIYAGWCGPVTCEPDPTFASGIDTNIGGKWHRVVGPKTTNGGDPLPNRWLNALRIDSTDPYHVYAVYGEYRRPWTSVPCACGHVFESHDGGQNWRDISERLPDAAATDLLIADGHLVVSMDVGVFVADAADPTSWAKLGSGIANAAVTGLTLTPARDAIIASTYGRGLWRIGVP